MASEPAPVRVSVWGELRGERKMPGVLRVLVGGQHAGTVYRDGAAWVVQSYTRRGPGQQPQRRQYAAAGEAVAAVVASGWSQRLGGRAVSPVQWTDRARRLAARKVTEVKRETRT